MDAAVIGDYIVMTYEFLAATGILYILIGAVFTAIVSRVALIPTLKKIDAIVDCIIEKGEDGTITPEESLQIMAVIKEQIGSDFWVRVFGFMFAKSTNVPQGIKDICETKPKSK